GAVRVVVLDTTRKGKVVLESEDLVLSERPPRGGPERWPRAFPPMQALVHGGDLWLTWRTSFARFAGRGGRAARGGGRPPPLSAARVSLRTGKVENVPGDKVPAPRRPALPSEVAKAVGLVLRPSAARTGVCGKYAVRVDVRPDGVQQKAVLRRWDIATAK